MKRVVTLKDVAQVAGVSTATVSYVLNNTKTVSPEVVSRVQEAVAKTGYRLNMAARALRTGQSKTFVLFIPDIANPFFAPMIKSIELKARLHGYATVLFESGYDLEAEARGLDFMKQHRFDGIVCVLRDFTRLPEQDRALPTVVIDYASSDRFSVHANDYEGGRLQARHATELGHRRAVAIWGLQSIASIRERRRGFLEESQGRLELVEELETPFRLELPSEAAQTLLSRNDYSFVVCGNDELAIATMRVLKSAGIRVPDDVSVIGFDDIPLCEIVEPSLSSIEHPAALIGQLAVESLMQQINGASSPHQVIVPVQLKARHSTGPYAPRVRA